MEIRDICLLARESEVSEILSGLNNENQRYIMFLATSGLDNENRRYMLLVSEWSE